MAKMTLQNGLLSLGARGKFGKPNGLGETWFGWTELGDDNPRAGIYQYHWNQVGKYYNKAKFYWNPPHITDPAMIWKGVFRNGVTAWHALSAGEKLAYNQIKLPRAQSGFTRFMTKYLNEHK